MAATATASTYFDQVQKLYIAYYQRPADPGGLLFWAQAAAAEVAKAAIEGKTIDPIKAIVNDFATSEESVARYGTIDADTLPGVLDTIYTALFNRTSDEAGKAWWVGEFAAGRYTAADIVYAILTGARGADAVSVANKVTNANMFTVAVDGRALTDATFGAGTEFAATYNDSDFTFARDWLAGVNSLSATIKSPATVLADVQANVANAGDTILNMQGNLSLTTAIDNITGTASADTFLARTLNNANTLQDGDRINAGAGIDTLYADMATNAVAITPIFTNLENVVIRAQSVPTDGKNGNNMAVGAVQIDAQRSLAVNAADQVTASTGVTRWESNNSRSDVIIEDVRIGNSQKTSDITIAMVETDPGNVDFGVYFNQHSLRNTSTSSGTLNIFVMDTESVKAGTAPLKNAAFNGFSFKTAAGATITLGGANEVGSKFDAAQTYQELVDAFTLGFKSANVDGVTKDISADYAVTLSPDVNMTTEVAKGGGASGRVAESFLNLTGKYLVVKSSAPFSSSDTVYKWTYAENTAPGAGAIAQAFNAAASSVSELVTSKVILDDVGMGSTGGDLVIGGMSVGETSTSRGVERFEIEVRDNSKLQTINGTNNALREVTIVNGAVSRTVADAYTNYASGDLTVWGNANNATSGTIIGMGSDTILKGVNSGNTALNGYTADHHGAFGFTDVRLIDGSAMTGKLAFTAQITADSIAKYITLVDTQPSPTGDVAGGGNVNFNVKGANFIYNGGGNNDTMVVAIDGGVAGSRSTVVTGQSDFTFAIGGGAGNDNITVNVTADAARPGNAQNWYNNQDLNNNITVDGGSGDDVIRTPWSGDKNILGGTGNDWIYSDNTGRQAGVDTAGAVGYAATPGTTSSTNGMWIFNTTDQVAASAGLAVRDITDVRSDANDRYTFFNTKLKVTFKGISSAYITIPGTNYRTTDLEINQAIKQAINADATLKALLVAEDGPANSLIVKSLIDGAMVPSDLVVSPLVLPVAAALATTNPDAMVLNATDVAGAAAAYGLTGTAATEAAVLAAMAGATGNGLYTTNADYATVMATDGAVNIVGAIGTGTTDNLIVPGTGDDIIVLSTTEGGSFAASSNETIKLEAGFGNDVIVNFDTTGFGVDHLDFTALGGVTLAAVGAYTDKSINVEPAVTVPTGSTAEAVIAAKITLAKAAVNNTAVETHVFVDVSANPLTPGFATVYSVTDPIGLNSATNPVTVTKQGTINLAGTPWLTSGLTAANFANSAAAGYLPNANEGGGTGSATTPVVTPPTYALAPATATVNEGVAQVFTLTTTNVANGTVLNYAITGTGITTADTTVALTGTVTVNNNTATLTLTPTADTTTEGAETAVVTLTSGTAPVATASLAITDTSLTAASGFTNVDLSTGTVAATAAKEAFVYDYQMVAGRPTKAGDGEVTITGFDVANDKLVFNDVGTGQVYTQAQFLALAGLVVADDPFATPTTGSSIYVEADNGVVGGVTLAGITSLAAVIVETLA